MKAPRKMLGLRPELMKVKELAAEARIKHAKEFLSKQRAKDKHPKFQTYKPKGKGKGKPAAGGKAQEKEQQHKK